MWPSLCRGPTKSTQFAHVAHRRTRHGLSLSNRGYAYNPCGQISIMCAPPPLRTVGRILGLGHFWLRTPLSSLLCSYLVETSLTSFERPMPHPSRDRGIKAKL